MIPDYDIEVWRNVGGVCTQIDNIATTYVDLPTQYTTPTKIHNFLMSELIRIKATQTVSGQVSEAEVVFDNDPSKKFQAGDIIIISLGFEATGRTNQKIFNGVVYEAAKESNDEDKTITLRARDWSFLLLTDKFTASYPVSAKAKDIVRDIMGDYLVTSEASTPFLAGGLTFRDDILYSGPGNCHDNPNADSADPTTIKVGQSNIHTDAHSYVGGLLVDNYIATFNRYWEFTGSPPYLQSEDANTIDKDTKVNWYEKNDDTHHVNVWSPVHQGWTHNSSNPWLHNNDDTDCIALPAEDSYIDAYDEHYSFEDIPTSYQSFRFDTGYPVLHIVARKENGAGGRCGAFGIRVYLKALSDPTWTGFDIPSFMDDDESYHDHSVDVSSFITSANSLSRFNDIKMKIQLSGLAGGGTDKGYIRVTQAYLQVHGWGLTNQGDWDDNYISQFSFGNVPFSSIPGESVTQADITIEARNDSSHNDPDLQHDIYFKISTDNGINWSSSFSAGAPITLDTWEIRTVSVLSVVNTIDKINNCRIKISAIAGGAYIGDHDYHETLLRVTRATLTVNASVPAINMYDIWRAYLYFNTANVPISGVIDNAFIRFYPTGKAITQDFDLRILKDPSDPIVYPTGPPPASSDYDKTLYLSSYPGTLGLYDGDLIVPGTSFDVPIDPDWIIKGGPVSKFCLRTTPDVDDENANAGIAPGTNEVGTVTFASAPELHVIYFTAPAKCEYKIQGSDLIEDTDSTRQLDFDGEPLTDSMTKVSDATEHDWYIDENKFARWFKRRDIPVSGSDIVIWDDDGTTFFGCYNGTYTDDASEKVHGTNSLKIVGVGLEAPLFYTSSISSNLSSVTNITFWFWGCGDSGIWDFIIFDGSYNMVNATFTDAGSGWHQITIPKTAFIPVIPGDDVDWSNIIGLQISKNTNLTGTVRFDYIIGNSPDCPIPDYPSGSYYPHVQYRDYNGSPDPLPGSAQVLNLMREDLTDYNVTDPEELLCNKVKVYGRNNKVIPWNYDDWSDSLGSASASFEWTGLLGSICSLQPAPPTPKARTNSIKISGATTGEWWVWERADGWCHTPVLFGPGSLEVEFSFACSTGKSIRLHNAGCTHSGTGHVEIYYKWGSGGTYLRLIYPDDIIENETQQLYPYTPPDLSGYVTGPTDTDLYIKYKLTAMGMYTTGCMNNFSVFYGDDSITGTEKFSARLRIPAPTVIWSEAGTLFWTLLLGTGADDSEETKKGNSSYRVTLTSQTLDFYHDYTTNQNYTAKPNIGFWFYGQNTGSTIDVEFSGAVYVPVMLQGYRYTITDNFMGWKWFEPKLGDFITIGGFVGWNMIRSIRFHGSGNETAIYRLDWLVNSDSLDQIVDLETKAAPKYLKFVAAPHYGSFPNSITRFLITFTFADGNTASTQVQFTGIRGDDWSTVEIPVGVDADGWIGTCSGTLQSIDLELTATFGGVPSGGDYLLIDWVHFDGARWYGEYEDATSELANGIRFKELFDDTLYSDTAANRRAIEFIKKFKDPIVTIKDVEVDYIGMENLDPGKVLFISNTIPEFADMTAEQRAYRIEVIEHHLEENDYYVRLILSIDPVYFEGNVYQISERVRRMEQRGNRKPAANPTEVD
jgi:hypothetical protein